MWCWTRMEIRWTDRVRSEEALCTIKDDRNIIRKIRRLTVLVTSFRFCLRKHVTEGMIEGMESEDPKENKIYWNFREDALDDTLESHFGRG
jgi:hypothetical protein